MNPLIIIQKYYDKVSDLYRLLLIHSMQVRDMALQVVDSHPELQADRQFVEEAAMIHDIGIFLTNAPSIYCFGSHEYIEHGYLGADILREEGFFEHALVCERHTGVGLSLEEIVDRNLPLPHRDMRPVSIEEQIICYADKFFSKSNPLKVMTAEDVASKLVKFGSEQSERFLEWDKNFK